MPLHENAYHFEHEMFGRYKSSRVNAQSETSSRATSSRSGRSTTVTSVDNKRGVPLHENAYHFKQNMCGRYKLYPVSVQSKTSSGTTSSRSRRNTTVTSVDDKARLHHRWVFLTYARCSLEVKDDFEEGFRDMLQRNNFTHATYYGCREQHAGEGIHYHVLVNFDEQRNWSNKTARERLSVAHNEGDSLHISTRRAEQPIGQFIDNHVKYCEKEGDCFGVHPLASVEKQAKRKRKWEEIGTQPTAPAKLAKLKKI